MCIYKHQRVNYEIRSTSDSPSLSQNRFAKRYGKTETLDASWLRELALKAGADDAGCVSLKRTELDEQRNDILRFFPQAKTLLSFVLRMNRENIRSPARSIANLEFHHSGDEVNDIARRITNRLEQRGIAAINAAMGFPMEA